MTRVLITGGTGFIGSHLAQACLARGDTVSILTRPWSDTGRLAEILPRITLLQAQPDDAEAVAGALALARPQTVFHLGSTNRFAPGEQATTALSAACELNLLPFLALLDAAARMRLPPTAFVRAGTIAEYGEAPTPCAEWMREAPCSAYGWAALAATRAMDAIAGDLPFAVVTARLALTYGPAQSDDFLIPRLIRHCLRGEPSVVRRPGDQRDLVHVDDVVAGLLRIADLPAATGPVVNLCSGLAPPMRDVAAMIARLTEAAPGLIACADHPGPASELRSDPALAWRALGWRPTIPLEDGLARTIDWERRQRTARTGKTTQKAVAT